MSEPIEDKGSWTIRAMPPESRKKALAAASKRSETAAQFMVRAIETQIAIDAGDRIEMPSERPKPDPEPQSNPRLSIAEMHALAEQMQVATEAAKAAGIPLPKTVTRQAFAVLDAAQRIALGKPPRPIRQRPSPLPAIEGQVVNGHGEAE